MRMLSGPGSEDDGPATRMNDMTGTSVGRARHVDILGVDVSRDNLGDAIILVACVVIAVISAVWGLDQAPREYGLLLVVTVIGAILMARKLFRA